GGDFVPAEIRVGEPTVRVKLRLKGDYTDHLEGEKWSMRVHVKRKNQLFGMRRFSLQAPRTRGFQAEPIVLDHYRREGVLAPRYSFAEVSVNGDDLGLMAVEESFGQELLESQQRREGVIICGNDSMNWQAIL
ncbi:MAG: CotH kinase family protein, partial [Myxococcota bacterium]